MLNQELLDKLNTRIEFLKKEKAVAEVKNKELYEVFNDSHLSYGEDKLFGRPNDFETVITSLENSKSFVEKCTEENIDLDKDYYLTDNIYFSVWYDNSNRFNGFFYVKDDSWLYDNYFGSHSGINEWITDLIDDEVSLFSQNSPYCHAFGTHSLKDYFYIIENNTKDVDNRVAALKAIVTFVEGTSSTSLHDMVVEMIEHRMNKMLEYGRTNFEDWEE